jgi:subfamily B ATP-binding cassette protein MsbA
MNGAILEIYRRYFRSFLGGLLLASVCWLGVAAEGSALSAIGRYLIDEVLEVNLILRPMLHGQPGQFVKTDSGLPNVPKEQAVSGREIADGMLPCEKSNVQILTSNLQTDAALQHRIETRPGKFTSQKVHLLLLVIVGLVVVHLFSMVMQTYAQVKLGVLSKQIVFRMRRHLHEKLMRLQLSFHDQHQTGRLLARAIDDSQVLENQFAPIITHLMMIFGLLVINTTIMYYISPKLTLIAWSVMPFYFFAHGKLCGDIRSLHRVQRKENGILYGLIRDRLANPRIVKGFGQEKRELIRFFVRAKDLFRRNRRIVMMNNTLSMICTFLAVIATGVPLGYGVKMVQTGELSVGYLLFFYNVSWGLFWPIAVLSTISATIQNVRISCERILEVLDEPIIIADHAHSKDISRFVRSLELKDISFKYREETPLALQGINLSIHKGQKVCLMGSSGSGKSTLGMQLLRLYDPTSGDVVVDGANLRDIKISSWRKRVSFVPQEPVLFSGTLAGNIMYGNSDATMEEVISAAKSAEIHDFIESLPDKYQTVIGENGLRLSGGQKQRLSLARALVTNPDILVLDDCTSALDADTESKIQKTLRTSLSGKTVVMISHRVSAASNADMIVVLDHGKIVETGIHQELFEKHGHYWTLVKDQLEEHKIVPLNSVQPVASASAA